MSTRLPLVAAQPGIWMAERLSTLPGAWSVAHYVELRGNLDPALLGRAIVTGLAQADTLSMRFCEDNGEAWQWVDEHRAFAEPDYCDLREARDPHDAALALMQADLGQNLRVDGGNPLVCHQLLRVADDCWYWYQRYHHLLVDGFSFPLLPARSRRFIAPGNVGRRRRRHRLPLSLRLLKSISATTAARPGSAIKRSGWRNATPCRHRHRSLRHRWRGGRPVPISGA